MPAKKMVDLQVLETSGVDHPAHMHEGFAVMKAANPTQARALFGALGKERTVSGNNSPAAAPTRKAVVKTPPVAPLTPLEKAASDAVQKAVDSKLQPILDELAKTWQDLQAVAQQSDPDVPSVTGAAPAAADPAAALGAPVAPVAAAAGSAEELAKSADLPEPVRKALADAATAVEKAQKQADEATAVAKAERDARLDNEAVAFSKATFANIAMDHEKVAPTLRKMELIDPAGAEVLKGLLTSTNAQLDGADLLKELGGAGNVLTGDTMAQVTQKAAALVASEGIDMKVAKARVFEENPQLADAIRAEQKG